jgi:hypothetical protein
MPTHPGAVKRGASSDRSPTRLQGRLQDLALLIGDVLEGDDEPTRSTFASIGIRMMLHAFSRELLILEAEQITAT